MAYTDTTWAVFELATEALLLARIRSNMLWVKGDEAAQTEIDIGAVLHESPHLKLTDATSYITKVFKDADVPVLRFYYAETGTDAQPGSASTYFYGLLDNGTTTTTLGTMYFVGTNDCKEGVVGFGAGSFTSSAPQMAVGPTKTGLFNVPDTTATLKVTGQVNGATLLRSGSGVITWAEAVPGTATYAGNARANIWKSTKVDDTGAPIVVSSTTKCTNLNVSLLDNLDWHGGLRSEQEGGVTMVSGTAVTLTTVTLNRAGRWLVLGTASVASGLWTRVNFQLRVTGGGTCRVKSGRDDMDDPRSVIGVYTAVAGNETITLDILSDVFWAPSPPASPTAAGELTCIWIGT